MLEVAIVVCSRMVRFSYSFCVPHCKHPPSHYSTFGCVERITDSPKFVDKRHMILVKNDVRKLLFGMRDVTRCSSLRRCQRLLTMEHNGESNENLIGEICMNVPETRIRAKKTRAKKMRRAGTLVLRVLLVETKGARRARQ